MTGDKRRSDNYAARADLDRGSFLDAMEATVQTKKEIIERIRRLGPELCALRVERLGLFGSLLRGQTTPDSDVDILVEFAPGQKTFDNFIHLAHRLEDTLQRRVEVVTRESLSPYIGPRILEETEYVSFSE